VVDAVLGGVLLALTLAVGGVFWLLLVQPDVMLSMWQDGNVTQENWFEHHPVGLRALRWTMGGTLFLFGFLTGLAWTFLIST
jgi:hypothetical protein